MGARVRSIFLTSAVLAATLGVAILLPLLWRDATPAPEAQAVAAARSRALEFGLVLEPCGPGDKLWDGGAGVSEAFQTAQPLAPRVEAAVHPSWGGAPWKVQLYDRDGQSLIGIVGFTPESWAARDAASLSGGTRKLPAALLVEFRVSADTGRRLESEWNRSIDAARAHGVAVADGTTYFFRAGDQCARTWSPPEGSRNAQLTDLLDTLAIGLDEEELRSALSRIPPPRPPLPRAKAPAQAD